MVSLFFVVAAMIEFSIVVLMSRKENAKIESADNPDDNNKDGDSDSTHYFNNAIFDTLFGSDQQFGLGKELRKKVVARTPKAPRFSSKTLDMVSSIVFPIAYAIYNLYYWYEMDY